jgi:hypothetical protein
VLAGAVRLLEADGFKLRDALFAVHARDHYPIGLLLFAQAEDEI